MTSVLIADDHPFLCEGVKAVLCQAGLEVVDTVGDGEAALAAIARDQPDVVILDITMPVLDGIATLEAMRRNGDQRPVVLLTAHIADAQLVAAMRAGVNGIVCKQGGSTRLVDAIRIVDQGGQCIPQDLIGRAMEISARQGQAANPLAQLTPREQEIAKAVAQGLRNREVAALIGASEGAIKVSLFRIYEKLGIDNRLALAMLLRDSGVLPS